MIGETSVFHIPPMHYFDEGNKYSGSADKIFRYKISPSDSFECVVWHGLNAIDCITEEEITARESFPMTDEGRLDMISWLEQRYLEFTHSHFVRTDI